ncbi:spore germination protein [Clostridiaceae bacterium 35-E11]
MKKGVKDEEKLFKYEEFERKGVSKDLQNNQQYLQEIFKDTKDIVFRNMTIRETQQRLMLVFVDGMVDRSLVNDHLIKSIMIDMATENYGKNLSLKEVQESFVAVSAIYAAETFDELMLQLLSGDTLLFMEGEKKALIIGSKGWESRGIDEPTTELNVKGPKDSFIETLKTNIVLIRRKFRDPNLAIETLKVGRRSKTDVALVYLKGVAMDGLVEEVRDKIKEVDVDTLIDSSHLSQLIEDKNWTIFPQMIHTERPDKAVAAIAEGRITILVDGSPFAILGPSTFSMYMDAPDDYHEMPIIASLIRITRYISFFLSATLPGIYIAITNFHPGMLPPTFALTIIATRVALPFPSFMEVFIMESIIEIMQEAGLRLPPSIGQTVSIVGGIVIGQAAVQAGLVSPIVTIIIAFTAIASFTLPSYSINLSSRVLRIPFVVAGSTLGFFGIIMLGLAVLAHMASIESFGIGYFEDFSPWRLNDLKDTVIKVPYSYMEKRPESLKPQDTIRIAHKNSKREDQDEK